MQTVAPISVGELFDKISVLEIKAQRIAGVSSGVSAETVMEMLNNVCHEKRVLLDTAEKLWTSAADLLYQDLIRVNRQIWDDVDEMHRLEKTPWRVIKIAQVGRRIARINDERAQIKRALNQLFKSEIVEEKLYR